MQIFALMQTLEYVLGKMVAILSQRWPIDFELWLWCEYLQEN